MRSLPPTGVLFGYLIVTVALAALVLWANPAIALLTGAALTITINRMLVTGGNTIGKYMLQAAIVLLGLKLDITALWQTSADYAGLIAIYVIGALLIGLAIAHGLGVDHVGGFDLGDLRRLDPRRVTQVLDDRVGEGELGGRPLARDEVLPGAGGLDPLGQVTHEPLAEDEPPAAALTIRGYPMACAAAISA